MHLAYKDLMFQGREISKGTYMCSKEKVGGMGGGRRIVGGVNGMGQLAGCKVNK